MVSKKKNKKAPANPARGFATTSVVSKSKVENDSQVAQQTQSEEALPESSREAIAVKPAGSQCNAKDLSELSPEELEAQLEESELQLFVEKYRAKAKKHASRNATRLLTERRLLRNQADSLPISRWLPDEVMQTIANHMRERVQKAATQSDAQTLIAPDDFVAKVWTLKQSLEGLGFGVRHCEEALSHLLRNPLQLEQARLDEARDGIWGLNVCLDMLGISYGDAELPSYESQLVTKKSHTLNGFNVAMLSGKKGFHRLFRVAFRGQ